MLIDAGALASARSGSLLEIIGAPPTSQGTHVYPPVTEAELAWYDLAKYAPSRLRRLTLPEWVGLLDDRLFLQALVEGGVHEQAQKLFESLQSDPLNRLGVTQARLSSSNSTDQPSVSLLRTHELVQLAAVAQAEGLEGSTCFDLPAGAPRHGVSGHLMHLRVDLSATRERLVGDFKAWLSAIHQVVPKATRRNYETTIAEWSAHDYLGYFDITLFARAHKKRVTPHVMAQVLGLTGTEAPDSPKDLLSAAKKSIDTFTWLTLAGMRSQVAAKR